MTKTERTIWLRERALALGFSSVGFSKALFMDEEARRLEQWLNNGFQGQMSYLENHFDKRVDPRKLVEGAKTVISFVFNYFPEEELKEKNYKIARYAYGEDYHFVLKDKLGQLISELKDLEGDFHARCFVDSAPVLERDWAKRSGLGWVGKNTLLIHPQKGSYFFLAEIILDLDFQYDAPLKDYCGSCRKCIEACPTQAISEKGYIMDGSKCISYLTIELKDEIPNHFKGQYKEWIFGCDICQEVCPWNRFSKAQQEERFRPTEAFKSLHENEWKEISEEVFQIVLKKSALKRTGLKGLERNIKFLEDHEK